MTRASSLVIPTVDKENRRLYNGTMRENARIIVEGMDGSGKTSLIDSLLQLSEYPRFERVRNDQGPRPDLAQWWMEQLDRKYEGIPLHDRFFYPELIYGPILRGSIGTSPGITNYVHSHLRRFAFLIYCRPPDHNIDQNLSLNPQMSGVYENRKALLGRYDKLMSDEAQVYGSRYFFYDYTKISTQVHLLGALEEYLSS